MEYFYSLMIGIIFIALNILISGSSFGQSAVTIEERPLVMPTYQIAPPDKNPIFYTGRTYQGAQGHIYPYPMYDVLTDNRKDQTYKAVYLENEYTELCVMPELGGRILSASDKTDQYDFFYRQHVIKPALIGMIGAWISGGVEWNIPDHHRASTMLPVDYKLENNLDGSKTVWVGETELSRRMKWEVGLSVYPGRSYVEATVKVINSTPFIQSFLYWANVSVFCDENYQVIFPPSTQFGVQHAKSEFTTWPVGQGVYGGVDRTGVDLSWWKNHPNSASIFAWNFDDDFLAGYDFGKDAGTVHVANHHVVGGKKFFLWGNNPEAKMWEKMLTETDGQYLELMVGAYSDNQPDYSWIAPGETREFKQYWYPIKKIGGVKCATIDAAVNFQRTTPITLKIGLNATALFKNAKVILSASGREISKELINIDPSTPYLKEFNIDKSINDTDLKIVLLDENGKELVSYQPSIPTKEEMPKPVERPKSPKEYKSNEELYLTGLRIEQFHNATIDPMQYYYEALSRDSLDCRVNTVMGIRCCKEGKFAEAEKYLGRAISRLTKDYTKPKDGEPFYYLGVVCQFQNRYKEASDAFWKATWYNGFESLSYFKLAELACIEENYANALNLVGQSIDTNANSTQALTLKAYILRKLGKPDEGTKLLEQVQNIDKLDDWSICESNFSKLGKIKQYDWGKPEVELFCTAVKGNVQSVLESVLAYGSIGAYAEAIQVIEQYKKLGEKNSNNPMLSYYSGFYKAKTGDKIGANKSFKEASQASADYCYPFRVEEQEILQCALKENPTDAKAYYYLGNLHYYLNQKEKAVADWEQSATADDKFYLVFRNLGFAYGEYQHDVNKALPAYEKSIELNNQDARLLTEYDVLKEKAGISPKDRLAFLEKNKGTVLMRDDAVIRELELYNITGQYDKAITILTRRHFHVWEGGGSIHNIFVDAFLLRGISELSSKQFDKALKDFKIAATYPDNLEVGEPNGGGRAAQVNYFIALVYSEMKDDVNASKYFEKASVSTEQSGRRGGTPDLAFYKAMALKRLNKPDADEIFNKIADDANKNLNLNTGLDFFSKFGTNVTKETRMADNYYLLGLSYLGKGDQLLANTEFKKALDLNQNHLWAKVFLNMNFR